MLEPEFIKQLRVQKETLLKEADAIEEAIQAGLRKLGLEIPRIPMVDHNATQTSDYPDYPLNDPLGVKINFLKERNVLPDWMRMQDIKKEIIKQEGSDKSVKSINNEIRELVERKILVMVKFNNSNKLVFYTTQKELFYQDGTGKWFPINKLLPDSIQSFNKEITSIECSLNK